MGISKRDEKGRTVRVYGEDQTRICPVCKKSYIVPAWRATDPKRGKFCSKACSYIGREIKGAFVKGHPDLVPKEKRGHSLETRLKMKEVNRKIAMAKYPDLWKNREHNKRKVEMHRSEYKEWRKSVFERDDYTCQVCNNDNTFLHADHIESWVSNEEKRYVLSNGVTLCFRCHFKKTYPNAEYTEQKAINWGVPPKYRKSYI